MKPKYWLDRKCQKCLKPFKAYKYNVLKGFGKFCSHSCKAKGRKGRLGQKLSSEAKKKLSDGRKKFFEDNPNPWLGRKHRESSKEKMRLVKLGKPGPWRGKKRPTEEKSARWMGDEVGYVGIHDWVRRWKGTPMTCESCGKTGLKSQQIHWANIDHKYRRVLDDYIRLCSSCHKKFDSNKK